MAENADWVIPKVDIGPLLTDFNSEKALSGEGLEITNFSPKLRLFESVKFNGSDLPKIGCGGFKALLLFDLK